jgi:hypothetical protein
MGRILRTSFSLRALSVTALLITALLMAPLAYGQVGPAEPVVQPQTVVDILHQFSDKADVIFAGQVLAIRRPNGGVVEVEFRVDQAIRGCTAGTPYILREWAGLWAGDNQRYRVGQRLLMLLHAPSAAGMSSPVGGLDGAIPIRQSSAAMAPGEEIATSPQPPYVDLRWLGARLPRAVSYQSEPAPGAKPADPQPLFFGQLAPDATASGSIVNFPTSQPVLTNASVSDASVPAQQASVDAVMGMLNSWQNSWQSSQEKAQHVAP